MTRVKDVGIPLVKLSPGLPFHEKVSYILAASGAFTSFLRDQQELRRLFALSRFERALQLSHVPYDRSRVFSKDAPVFVPKKAFHNLEQLITPPTLSLALAEEGEKEYFHPRIFRKAQVNFDKLSDELKNRFESMDSTNGIEEMARVFMELARLESKTLNAFNRSYADLGKDVSGKISEVEQIAATFSPEVAEARYRNKKLQTYRRKLARTDATLNPREREYEKAKRRVGLLLAYSGFPQFNLSSERFRTKMRRTAALMSVDETLGSAYFAFNPFISSLLYLLEKSHKSLRPSENGHAGMSYVNLAYEVAKGVLKRDSFLHFELHPALKSSKNFWNQDTEVYKEILGVLAPEPTIPRPAYFEQPRVIVIANPEEEKRKQELARKERYLAKITSSILGESVGVRLSEDMQERINYFAIDVFEQGLPEDKLAELCGAFASFGLEKPVIPRRGVRDVQVRNFFDDLALGYLRKGQVPSRSDIAFLYEKVMRE